MPFRFYLIYHPPFDISRFHGIAARIHHHFRRRNSLLYRDSLLLMHGIDAFINMIGFDISSPQGQRRRCAHKLFSFDIHFGVVYELESMIKAMALLLIKYWSRNHFIRWYRSVKLWRRRRKCNRGPNALRRLLDWNLFYLCIIHDNEGDTVKSSYNFSRDSRSLTVIHSTSNKPRLIADNHSDNHLNGMKCWFRNYFIDTGRRLFLQNVTLLDVMTIFL